HVHLRPVLCLVLTGEIVEMSQAAHICTPGSVHYHPARRPHAIRAGHEGARCFVAEINPDWLTPTVSQSASFTEPKVVRGLAAHLIQRMRVELAHQDEVSCFVLEGLTLELLAVLSRSSDHRHRNGAEYLSVVEDYLRAHFQRAIRL